MPEEDGGGYSGWHGQLLTFDGTNTADFTEDDVDEIIAAAANGVHEWDGECAAIFTLKDGRFVSYESAWGPTGSGFSEDAYGGEANIYFASSKENAIRFGLSESGRTLLNLTVAKQ
jgi:hypothetical protein